MPGLDWVWQKRNEPPVAKALFPASSHHQFHQPSRHWTTKVLPRRERFSHAKQGREGRMRKVIGHCFLSRLVQQRVTNSSATGLPAGQHVVAALISALLRKLANEAEPAFHFGTTRRRHVMQMRAKWWPISRRFHTETRNPCGGQAKWSIPTSTARCPVRKNKREKQLTSARWQAREAESEIPLAHFMVNQMVAGTSNATANPPGAETVAWRNGNRHDIGPQHPTE